MTGKEESDLIAGDFGPAQSVAVFRRALFPRRLVAITIFMIGRGRQAAGRKQMGGIFGLSFCRNLRQSSTFARSTLARRPAHIEGS
jgi:hypothetical protein